MIPGFTPTQEMVERKIASVLPDSDRQDVWEILSRYGTKKHEQEPLRVYLAILKLCDENPAKDLAGWVETARQDFRDVLAWAESPNLMQITFASNAERKAAIRERDNAQYLAWLEKT